MIYSIGDSHAYFTFSDIPGVRFRPLGPVTMKRIGNNRVRKNFFPELGLVMADEHTEYVVDTLLDDTIRGMGLQPTDVVVISCGEGDVRCFIKPQLEQRKLDPEQLLFGMAERYVARLKTLDTNGAQVAILSIPPPSPYARCWNIEFIPSQLNLPPAGTDRERDIYTRMLNHYVACGCNALGLLFIDVHSQYADSDGMLMAELSDGGVHIKDTSRVRDILRTMGLL